MALIITLFFLPLFWPQPQLIVTPDFIRSDSLHSSIAGKFLMSQAIKNMELPLWSAKLGMGFPLFAEGQIGLFFLPNLLLFRFFDPVMAYNAALLLAVIFFATGTYVFVRLLNNTRAAALFGATTAALSGPVITQLTHSALLQSFSLLPWVLVMTHLLATRPTPRIAGIFILIASQQLFTGSPQPASITFLFALSYYLLLVWEKSHRAIRLAVFIGVYMGVILLSAIQLLPSQEFLSQTNPAEIGITRSTLYGFPFKHFLTFFNPFALGNPKLGTYFAQNNAALSIFWENTGYIGLLPLCLIVIALLVRRGRLGGGGIFWGAACATAILLMMGNSSPLYLIYSLWPFTLFHVPSRFIWIVTFILVVASVKAHSILTKRMHHVTLGRIVIAVALIAQAATLWYVWSGYHLYGNANEWLTKPQLTKSLQSNSVLATVGWDWSYYQQFAKGWKRDAPYRFLQNAMPPNTSALLEIDQFDVISGRNLWRPAVSRQMLTQEIERDERVATVSATGTKLLRTFTIGSVISSVPIVSDELQQREKLSFDENLSLYLYETPDPAPRAYLATNTLIASTAERAQKVLQSDTFVPGKTALLESDALVKPETTQQGTVSIVEETNTAMRLTIRNNPADTFLVISATYYPGWQAYVDGNPVPVYPANVKGRAIPVSSGDHEVTLRYTPKSFQKGAILSGIGLIVVLVLMAFPLPSAVSRILRKTLALFSHHGGNRGR